MKTNRFLPIAAMLCALLLFSCTTNIEPPPPPPLPQEPNSSSTDYSSSSGSECISSGSYCNYGGCSVWSSDGWSCSLHINGWANEGGCYPMPTDDNCSSGTSVSVCPANAVPPASNYCRLPSSSSAIASSSSISIVPSSSSSPGGTSGTFTDARDSKIYRLVKIGTQVWMAENLNFNAEGSKCYNNQESNCTTYGRLYDWSMAMALASTYNSTLYSAAAKHKGVCPSGWHIPSDAEWDVLMTAVGGMSSTDGKYLKATSGWYNCGPSGSGSDYLCEDAFGFSALPGGYGLSTGYFSSAGDDGRWWSATENDASNAWHRNMYYAASVGRFYVDKTNLFSVRCVQD